MSSPEPPLLAAIRALEAQRGVLGDAVVDAAIAPLRAQWQAIQAGAGAQPPAAAAEPAAAATHAPSAAPSPPAPTAPSAVPEGELRQLTILFLDVVGSTALSQRIGPEEVHEVVDGLLVRCTEIVRTHGGRVLQYAGDSLLAVFGAGRALEDDAERAVLSGLALLAEGRAAGVEVLAAHGHAGFDVRVGVHTGAVLLGGGVVGEGAVRGLAVNVAARMEQTAPPGRLRISQDTYRQVRGAFELEAQDPIVVKGVDGPVITWLVRRALPRADRGGPRGVEGLHTGLVGREAELEALRQAWRRLHAARRQERVLVVGEAGLGKSRLLSEFERWIGGRAEACQRVRARADPQTERQPFGLLRDMLTAWLAIDDGDPPALACRKVEQGIVPLLEGADGADLAEAHAHCVGHLLGFDFAASRHVAGILDDPAQLRSRAFHAVARTFRAIAAPGRPPLLLTLDDLHWADDGSLDLLDFVAREPDGLPMLVIGLTRPTLFERRPGWSEAGPGRRIELQPLDAEASVQLAAELLQRLPSVPHELEALLIARAEGNPFYMEELVKMLVDQGALRPGPDGWRLDAARLLADAVPTTLTGVLQARLDRLPGAERLALQQASVVGAVFWAPALAVLDAAAPAQLAALAERGLVRARPESSLHGAAEYTFAHHLLREVSYDSVLKRTRRALHGRAAAWLAAQTGLRAEGLLGLAAEHFERAGDAPQACEHYARAAEAARRRYAHDAVLGAVASALPMLAQCDEGARAALHWRLLDARERTLDLLGRRAEQRADLQALGVLADTAGDDRRRAELACRASLLAMLTGDLPGAERAAREAMARAAAAGDRELQLNGQRLVAGALARQGDVAQALSLAEDGLAQARAAGWAGLESRFLNALTLIHARRNDLQALRASCEQATRLRHELGDRRNEAIGLATLGGLWLALGQLERAAAVLDEALRLHRTVGDRSQEPIALAYRSQLARWRGQADEACTQARHALAIAEEVQARVLQAFAGCCLGEAALALDAIDAPEAPEATPAADKPGACAALGEARAAFTAARDAARAAGSGYEQDARGGLARLALRQGRLAEAQQEVEWLLARRRTGRGFEGAFASRAVELGCWQVLDRVGDPRAATLLQDAASTLRAEAAAITDPLLRQGFLEQVPEHRLILAAWRGHPEAAPRAIPAPASKRASGA